MSVNVKELLGNRLRTWIVSHLADGEPQAVADPFWVIPIDEASESFAELCEAGLKRLNETQLIGTLVHENFLFIILKDDESQKLVIARNESTHADWRMGIEYVDFTKGSLNFLQLSHVVTKFGLKAQAAIPAALVKTLPIFEDDLLPHFPRLCVLHIDSDEVSDPISVVALKAILALESSSKHVEVLRDSLISVGYAIPSADHEWIFGQLFSAIQAQRLINFYLELYKLFEFFFPLQSIFNLADRLGYAESELTLLDHCRGTLSWNVNHQRGARSAATYATTSFAEICLGKMLSEAGDTPAAFKERAIEKMTNARHELTHQDFRAISIAEKDLLRLSEALLVFLRDAFLEYGSRLANRRKR